MTIESSQSVDSIVLQCLIIIRWHILGNILYVTLQYATKVIDCCGVHGLVFAKFIDDSTGNVMIVD